MFYFYAIIYTDLLHVCCIFVLSGESRLQHRVMLVLYHNLGTVSLYFVDCFAI